jgi:hypothetical protein
MNTPQLENILSTEEGEFKFKYPEGFPRTVSSVVEVEKAATDLRKAWDLGIDSIENLTSLLEDKGIKVGIIDADNNFDACTRAWGLARCGV